MVYFKYPRETLSILPHWGELKSPCGCGREFKVDFKSSEIVKISERHLIPRKGDFSLWVVKVKP